ncbi:hypothetical protein KY290_033997 [Solanum tuberosum]|uniref:Uncharacterized protein n=1 Tax=Solanum tuberosum TaxID=4113 RepID=A0ABQ7U309_SOLTU|nr:hypothetical protein KY289_033377 [Solanum tuberosum]KAH0649327.1 hypothetical protein KY285_034575 [Solanum tuberosum]KAH0740954.1 hypothetical protein KY290_033997 [Solanum tuberosum]
MSCFRGTVDWMVGRSDSKVCKQTYDNPLHSNPAYSVVKHHFVDMDDTVPQKIVVHKDSHRGVHFRRAGPHQKVCLLSSRMAMCNLLPVTNRDINMKPFTQKKASIFLRKCGGLCPGLKGAALIMRGVRFCKLRGQEIRGCCLKVVAGIPKTIDNDIPIIDKSFGFDTVEEVQRPIHATHVEAQSP